VNVGARQLDADRYATRVGQDMAFGAEFCALGDHPKPAIQDHLKTGHMR
jgi:hypothetical protein